jgi:transcriptional regulator with XRE-family HTH domain
MVEDERLREFAEKISDDLYHLKRILARNCMRLRKQVGWTQRQLADKLGLSQSHIQYLESGLGNPTVELILKVAKALEVEITEFFVKSVWELNHYRKSEFSVVKAAQHELKKMAVHLPEGWDFQKISIQPLGEVYLPPRKKMFRQIFFCLKGSLSLASRKVEQATFLQEGDSATLEGALALSIKNGPGEEAEIIHLCYREK